VASAAAAWATVAPTVEVRLTAAALALAAEAGGAQARAIEGVAATLRERAAARADIRAQSAQARLSALVIGVLPLAFTVWCVLTDPRIASFLFATSAGWACLLGGLGLDALGGVWMARLVREASS
jgi:tight adherence protein B